MSVSDGGLSKTQLAFLYQVDRLMEWYKAHKPEVKAMTINAKQANAVRLWRAARFKDKVDRKQKTMEYKGFTLTER